MKRLKSILFAGALLFSGYTNAQTSFTRSYWSNIDKSSWKIVSASSEQTSEGPARNVIDGSNSTYWHSMYSPTTSQLPDTLVIDFGEVLLVRSVEFVQRSQQNRMVKDISIQLSSNGTSWGTRRAVSLESHTDKQSFSVTLRSCQYMRLIITSKPGGDNTLACLAEVGVTATTSYHQGDYASMNTLLNTKTDELITKNTAALRQRWEASQTSSVTPVLRISANSAVTTDYQAQEITSKVTTNITGWSAQTNASWITLTEDHTTTSAESAANKVYDLSLAIAPNNSLYSRTDSVIVTGGGLSTTIPVTQAGVTLPENMIPTDIYQRVTSASGSSAYTSAHTITNAYDRSYTTNNYYTTGGVNGVETAIFNFDNATIDYMRFITGGSYGIGPIEIYVKRGEGEYELIVDENWNYASSDRTIDMPTTLTNVTAVKLIMDASRGVAIREWECWAKNSDHTLRDILLDVFTDQSCAQLREGVTAAQIAQLPTYFAILAGRLQTNNYQTQYRIGTYNAYTDPDAVANLRNITAYSRLDNPTGIYVKSGETFYVLVGNTHGEKISIGVNASSSCNVTSLSLKEGVNKLTAPKEGLLYIMYHTMEEKTHAPIRVHIPEGSGQINGLWDITTHQDEEWVNILNNAVYEVVDIVGEHTHMIIHTEYLKKNLSRTTGIKRSVEIWDGISQSSHRMMGWDKYPLPIDAYSRTNRQLGCSFTYDGAPMFSGWYYCGYKEYTILNELLYPGVLNQNGNGLPNNIWGIGHETGHANQHCFNWRSMSESSNNTFAQVALDEIINKIQLGISDSPEDDNKRNNAATDMLNVAPYLTQIANGTHFHDIDGWPKWGGAYYHFYLWFVKLGHQPDFYKDIFEALRQNDLGDTYSVGERHLNWYIRCCEIAQLDFTEFFETYGWFEPIDHTGNQYGAYRMTITPETAAAAKAEVAAKGYPTPEVRLQFIHQFGKTKPVSSVNGYWTYYRDNAQISDQISCSVSGSRATITNGAEAAIFAVETDGKIVGYYDTATFTFDSSKWNSTSKIYAIPIQASQPYVQLYPNN